MNTNELLEEIIGLNADQTAKSLVTLTHNVYSEDADRVEIYNELALDNPAVIIDTIGSITQVQLAFKSAEDSDLRILWNIIQKFNDFLKADSELDGNKIHFISLSIIPKTFDGRYFITATEPLFICVCSASPSEKPNLLNLYFNNENVEFYETDEIDAEQIQGEIEREIAEAERQEQIAEIKRQEKAEIEERRNRLIQNRRQFK